MAYKKITSEHPSYGYVQLLLARGAFACDSVDHNDNAGCSNPDCRKFVKKEVSHDTRAEKAGPNLSCQCGARSAPLVEGAYCRRCHKPTVLLIKEKQS